ncbi:unnamed protein product [Ranitomeya imitator]|uniref:Cytochrome P450 n=1 Tax=Ranitomeya imitator TaxID=111125 RepID=A0ABN9LDD1_9NEOB|nr:unnamed protein product [Ranitomeya imitator]
MTGVCGCMYFYTAERSGPECRRQCRVLTRETCLSHTSHHAFQKRKRRKKTHLSETYGPVFTIYLSSAPAVVLIGYDCVKEALIDNGNMFSFRGPSEVGDLLFKDYGMILTNGERWKQLRRFSLSTLRNFGMGKRSIEERIQEEARYLTEEIGKNEGTAFDPTHLLTLAVSNVICSVVFGKRFDYEDVKFRTLLTLLKELILLMSSTWGILLNIFPKTLSFIPGPHQKIFTNLEKLKDFIAESLENHKVTLDPNCPRDFIDCFLIKMEEEKSNPKTEFHFDNLFGTVMDLFFAGTETTSTTQPEEWFTLLAQISRRGNSIYMDQQNREDGEIFIMRELQYAACGSDDQIMRTHSSLRVRKIQKEMDQVIGRNQCPSVDDRVKMPYTDAVIHEIQRFADITPLGLPHGSGQDTTFRGYHIPKVKFMFWFSSLQDIVIFPALTSVLKDPKYFKNPKQFDPTNFLNDNGSFRKNEAFVPFSLGNDFFHMN